MLPNNDNFSVISPNDTIITNFHRYITWMFVAHSCIILLDEQRPVCDKTILLLDASIILVRPFPPSLFVVLYDHFANKIQTVSPKAQQMQWLCFHLNCRVEHCKELSNVSFQSSLLDW